MRRYVEEPICILISSIFPLFWSPNRSDRHFPDRIRSLTSAFYTLSSQKNTLRAKFQRTTLERPIYHRPLAGLTLVIE